MANPNLGELVATTLRNRSAAIADNVTTNNVLLARLKERGNVKPFSGGRTILQPLFYQENSKYQAYSGWDVIDVAPTSVIDAAEYSIKQVAVPVSMNGLQQLQNSGKEQAIDWLEALVKNAEDSLANGMSDDIYSDGTGTGGKQIDGLQTQVADSPSSGTVGGISRTTWSFWRNISADATTDYGAAATSANIQSYMNRVAVQVVRGRDRPDLIVADNNYYRLYLESLQAIQRITSDKMAAAGFTSIKYLGMGGDCDVALDGGIGGGCPANHMYFLNTKYIHFRPHRDRDAVPLGDRMSVNQDAFVRIIAWAGNMTMSGAKFQAVLKD